VKGLGVRVWGVDLRDWRLKLKVWVFNFRVMVWVQGLPFTLWGSGFRI